MVQTMPKENMSGTTAYREAFERFENQAAQPAWLLPLRRAGMARFAEFGFPTLQQEDWRFTNVAPIAKLPFHPVLAAPGNGITKDTLAGFTFSSLASLRLVFVNGHFRADLSSLTGAEPGVCVKSLASALKEDSALLEKHLARYAVGEDNSFTSLNTAFFQDGALVQLPAGKSLEKPIHLLFISTLGEAGASSHPRILVLAHKHSSATILESYVSTVDAPYLTNGVTELVLEEGAQVEHCKFQDEAAGAFHVAAIHAQLGRGSNFISHSIATGARLSRNNIRAVLAGEGVECVLNGLYLTRGEQLADHHMVVEHAQPHCNSHEYYNGILDGRSRGVFHGRILVRPAAQKTDAKQTNKNLLLSEAATADTKPQLEIYADDVKCTHGATVGQLNEESVFYLRSRGLGADTARRMLIHAFAGEIIERICCASAREELDQLVWRRLEANPHLGSHH